jgi:hypothetical protein
VSPSASAACSATLATPAPRRKARTEPSAMLPSADLLTAERPGTPARQLLTVAAWTSSS